MEKYTTSDAVNFALNGKPVEFKAAFDQLLADRLPTAVEVKREEVAKSVFPTTNVFNGEDEGDTPVELGVVSEPEEAEEKTEE
jgi:hypothetical protein